MSQKLIFMLANVFSIGMKGPKKLKDYNPPIGWYKSEKLDGYRARWDPRRLQFISRQNKPTFSAPQWFKNAIPNIDLDGELYQGRDGFQKMGAARKKEPIDEEWFDIKYYIYDAPEFNGTFKERYEFLKSIMPKINGHWIEYRKTLDKKFHNVSCPVVLTKHTIVKNIDEMNSFYKNIIDIGGEGIMLKDPNSEYVDGRSHYMLKYKPTLDAEAVITGFRPGTGKYNGMLGAFICQPLISKGNFHILDKHKNHEFAISGMDDGVRKDYENTHPIGTIITYEYTSLTDSGKPRFARYVRIRTDVEIGEQDDKIISDDILKRIMFIFEHLSNYEKINGQVFKSSAYKKAIEALKNLDDDSQLIPNELIKMKGIGEKILEKIIEIMKTGTCTMYEKIKDIKDPRKIFMDIHGVGQKKANDLVKEGFKTIDDLRKSDVDSILNNVQKKGLKYYEDIQKRIPYEEIIEHEKFLKSLLNSIDKSADLTIAGSYRRKKPDSGDIDVLINTPSVKNNSIYNEFIDKLVETGYLVDELSRGQKKYMGLCNINSGINRRIDLMYTKEHEYPFAILYFTGSKEFNVNMRKQFLEKGISLNEYNLTNVSDKKKINKKFKTEKDIFDFINMKYIKPENR